jgi:hypothetical protein
VWTRPVQIGVLHATRLARAYVAMRSSTVAGPRCPCPFVSDPHQGTMNGQGLPGCRNEILRYLPKFQPVRHRQGSAIRGLDRRPLASRRIGRTR